ncbi:MAG TPA: ketoacyl-ACP synthase III [Mucilaginibacter sp.]|nr:ketoacyl-ACP synthase III [Mucilaginibacter sp.]
MNSKITAISVYAPEKRITNAYFESIIDTNDEWIVTRTGIRERRFAADDQFTSDLCIQAAKNLAADNNVALDDVDFIIVSTTTADQVMPSTASQIQNGLGIQNAGCLDIMAACAGFVYGLVLAKGLIASGTHKKILVFGAETLSKFTDYTDRTSCILFGDGAGVALVEPSDRSKLFNAVTGADGSHGKDLYLSQSSNKIINGEYIEANGKIHQNGKVVFKWAIQTVSAKIRELLAKNNMQLNDLDWVILHSANMRIIEGVAGEIGCPMEKMLSSIEYYGNTSSASIPLSWSIAMKEGKIKPGQKILMLGFGGGLTFAGIIVEA